jgi:short-subunit dehydrogenase
MAKTALITGASAGLGLEYARLFAADRHDVVLVARRTERLEAIARDLSEKYGIKAHVLSADLASAGEVERLLAEIGSRGLTLDFLVNNAGFGDAGAFLNASAERALEMVQVNVSALVALTRAILPSMIERGHGRVLNIGSTAGFQPGPYMSVYYATKAFVNSFTEALAFELRGTGVTATVSCPGATATEFATVAGTEKSRLFSLGAASSAQVAREGYDAMHSGRTLVVHGLKNRFGVHALRVSPRALVTWLAASLNRTPETPRLPR